MLALKLRVETLTRRHVQGAQLRQGWLLWFAAATFLVQRLLADRPPAVRWAALVFLVALPPLYGPMDVISFGEPLAWALWHTRQLRPLG